MQGLFSRALDWIAGTTPAEPSSRGGQQGGEAQEFLMQTAGPDGRVAGQKSLGQQQGMLPCIALCKDAAT